MGFPVTEADMSGLAAKVGEHSMVGRVGGAPTFAVGMAQMFSRLVDNPTAIAIWYHFAIMFEALFILTTIDAGTRVGRFLVQDLFGAFWKPLGNTESTAGNLLASVAFVVAWGYSCTRAWWIPWGASIRFGRSSAWLISFSP
jgi:carbon starvation protein